jgi:hypothetical protein
MRLRNSSPSARIVLAAAILALAAGLVASVGAGTQIETKKIIGTPRADVLKGTPAADVIEGRGGNDTLFGGKGNDKLIGGEGKDTYNCGPGKDTVIGDKQDVKPGKTCEVQKGFPQPPARPQCSDGIDNDGDRLADYPADEGCTSPDDDDETGPPSPHPGHYTGKTSEGLSIDFDVASDGKTISNVSFYEGCLPVFSADIAGPITVNLDRTFATNYSEELPFSSSASGSIQGVFDPAGNASGTLTLNWYGFGILLCSSGTVTWTAT